MGWESWYNLLPAYKTLFGHLSIPVSYKTPQNFNLGDWAKTQRLSYSRKRRMETKGKVFKKGVYIISQSRIDRLNELSFPWSLNNRGHSAQSEQHILSENVSGHAQLSNHRSTYAGRSSHPGSPLCQPHHSEHDHTSGRPQLGLNPSRQIIPGSNCEDGKRHAKQPLHRYHVMESQSIPLPPPRAAYGTSVSATTTESQPWRQQKQLPKPSNQNDPLQESSRSEVGTNQAQLISTFDDLCSKNSGEDLLAARILCSLNSSPRDPPTKTWTSVSVNPKKRSRVSASGDAQPHKRNLPLLTASMLDTTDDIPWSEYYYQLAYFKATKEHAFVPPDYVYNNFYLGQWLIQQRAEILSARLQAETNNQKLAPDIQQRIEKLKAIGFEFDRCHGDDESSVEKNDAGEARVTTTTNALLPNHDNYGNGPVKPAPPPPSTVALFVTTVDCADLIQQQQQHQHVMEATGGRPNKRHQPSKINKVSSLSSSATNGTFHDPNNNGHFGPAQRLESSVEERIAQQRCVNESGEDQLKEARSIPTLAESRVQQEAPDMDDGIQSNAHGWDGAESTGDELTDIHCNPSVEEKDLANRGNEEKPDMDDDILSNGDYWDDDESSDDELTGIESSSCSDESRANTAASAEPITLRIARSILRKDPRFAWLYGENGILANQTHVAKKVN